MPHPGLQFDVALPQVDSSIVSPKIFPSSFVTFRELLSLRCAADPYPEPASRHRNHQPLEGTIYLITGGGCFARPGEFVADSVLAVMFTWWGDQAGVGFGVRPPVHQDGFPFRYALLAYPGVELTFRGLIECYYVSLHVHGNWSPSQCPFGQCIAENGRDPT